MTNRSTSSGQSGHELQGPLSPRALHQSGEGSSSCIMENSQGLPRAGASEATGFTNMGPGGTQDGVPKLPQQIQHDEQRETDGCPHKNPRNGREMTPQKMKRAFLLAKSTKTKGNSANTQPNTSPPPPLFHRTKVKNPKKSVKTRPKHRVNMGTYY